MKKKLFPLALMAVLIFGLILPVRAADGPVQRLAPALQAPEAVSGIAVHASTPPELQTPSQEEIRAKWDQVTYASFLYATEPSVSAPYGAGQLTDEFLESGITYLNYVRFVAGLPEITLDETLTADAQHGAVVLAAIDELTHFPHQPADMEDAFFNRGYGATSTANISARWGYDPLTCIQSSIRGCMDDSGENNLATLGHRRWFLNPSLGKVGFGYAQSATGWSYVVTPVFDYSGTGCSYDFLSWPVAGNHPTNLFDIEVPWSLTLNPSVFQAPNLSTVQITITRESDGKQWHFDQNTGNPVINTDAYMTVNHEGYGVRNCIIFHPGSRNVDAYTGTFRVDVSGIFLRNGTETTLSYDVSFFDVDSICPEHHYETVITEPTCTAGGYTTFTCPFCGDSYVDDYVEALGHDYDPIVLSPTCEHGGYTTYVCTRCDDAYVSDYTDAVDHSYENGHCKWCGKEALLAAGICGENLTWQLSFDGTLVIAGTGAMYDYAFAETPWWANLEDIRQIVIQDGATRIGNNAFRDAVNLTGVSLSDTITEIGCWAFMGAENLTAVILPEYLTSLEQEAFLNCHALEEIELPGTLSFIDAGIFSQCYALKRAVIHSAPDAPSLVMGNSVFSSCTSLEAIEVDEDHFCLKSIDGVLYNYSGEELILMQYPAGKQDEHFEIPQGTVEIFQLALDNVDALEELIIPDGVRIIGDQAFQACDNLHTVRFGGDAPEFYTDVFWGLTVTAYYPADNATWTKEVMQNYGGTITWVPYGEASEPTAKFTTISTSLGGNIAMNFYLELSEDLVSDPDAYIQFTYAGKTVKVPLSEGVLSGGVYRFSCPITSKNMTDDITAQVYNADGPVGASKTMDVATYCNWVIANYTDAKTVNLMKAMLNYGASAQLLFNYRTDDLANAALAESDKVLRKVDASAYVHSRTGEEEGIKPTTYTLLLDSETTVRVYFQLTGTKSIEEYTFTVDGVEVTPVYKNGLYYIQKTDIGAHRLDELHVFTCGNITIRYGGLSYVNQVMTYYTEGTTFDMASALFAYSRAAEAYIG